MFRRRVLMLPACAVAALLIAPAVHAQHAPQIPAAISTPAPAAPAQFDLTPLVADAQGWLTDLIRINTTNPPGNEMEAAKYIVGVLQKEGISAEVVEMGPGRGVAIGRLQAGPLPDGSKSLLLAGHLDVLGADKSKWSVDPFAGLVKDGYIYGRGALDDKGMVAANMAVIVALKRTGVHLNRDVIFLAGDDEGQRGAASIKFLIGKYWDKIACGFAINQGGQVALQNGKVQYVGIQMSEKTPRNVAVIATGAPGNAAIPQPDSAVLHLAAAIEKIGAMETPIQPTTVTRRYFEQLAQVEDEDTAKWMRALETPERLDLAARRLAAMSPAWNAMLRDSISATELRAEAGPGMLPSEARASLAINLLPGNSVDTLVAQMRKMVNDTQVQFEIEPETVISAPPSSLTSDLYAVIARVVPQQFPGAIAVPVLAASVTDSTELRLHNVQAYGLFPFPLTDADSLRMGGDDERIPVASFRAGIEFLYRTVHEFVAAQ